MPVFSEAFVIFVLKPPVPHPLNEKLLQPCDVSLPLLCIECESAQKVGA